MKPGRAKYQGFWTISGKGVLYQVEYWHWYSKWNGTGMYDVPVLAVLVLLHDAPYWYILVDTGTGTYNIMILIHTGTVHAVPVCIGHTPKKTALTETEAIHDD
jgi:hypothetical protein